MGIGTDFDDGGMVEGDGRGRGRGPFDDDVGRLFAAAAAAG